MKIRILAVGLAWTAGLCGQHHRFSWQEACFKNPAAPYCDGHDFAIKPTRAGKNGALGSVGANADFLPPAPEHVTPSVIVVGRIDWRFADPLADGLAGFNFSQHPASPLARTLMTQLGAKQDLDGVQMQKIFEGLAGAGEVALSIRDNRTLVMVTGLTADSTLPALQAGWKAAPLPGNAMLAGHADAVDQALQRIAMQGPPDELARLAEQRHGGSDFWAIGSAKLAGPEAGVAGLKRFSLTASIQDSLTCDEVFEFDGVPDANILRMWPATLGGATIEGNLVHVSISMEADEVQQRFGQIAASLLGQRLGALVKAAQYLPVRGHTKPMIYGLEGGAKEVNQNPQ